MDFDLRELMNYVEARADAVNAYLRAYMERRCVEFPKLGEAMSYSLFAGGKRLRPILAMAACEACGGDGARTLPFGAAIEMIHTFSLIHDDLPSMDNDDFRRSKPTSHRVFGEAHAILAGDALLSEAFRVMSDPALYPDVPVATGLAIMREVADAAGVCGMVGGQSLDLLSENRPIDPELLDRMHECKTARFIAASAVAGGLVAGASDERLSALREYGLRVGLAFQIVDDCLNAAGEEAAIGKSVGSDAAHGKATYPAFYGLAESRLRAAARVDEAMAALAPFGDAADRLRTVARFIVERDR